MCWTKEVSLYLAILGTVFTLDQVRRYRAGNYKSISIILFYGLYTIMEWFQYIQHLHGFKSCDSTNTQLTTIAHFLIWLQPVVMNYHSYATCKKQDKSLFKYTIFATIVAMTVSTISLYIGYQKSLKGLFPKSEEDLCNIGPVLCTKPDHIHFSWFFPYDSLSGYRPHGFTWIIFAVGPHLFKNGKINVHDWFGLGYVYSFFIILGWFVSAYVVGSFSSPLWSFWCVHSITYTIVPYIFWYIVYPFFPKSWTDSNFDDNVNEDIDIVSKQKKNQNNFFLQIGIYLSKSNYR